jgi:hypothetical protein
MIVQESQYNSNRYSNSSKREGAIYLVPNAAAAKYILMKIARPAQGNGFRSARPQESHINVNNL